MSKKENFISALCFAALVGAAIATVVSALISIPILDSIIKIILYGIAGYYAYFFTKGKPTWVKVVYWVSLTIAFIFIILPAIGINLQ